MLPDTLEQKLGDAIFHRANSLKVEEALVELGLERVNEDFKQFFTRYCGPIGSDLVGYEMLDLFEDEPSIVSATKVLRSRFALPSEFVALSDLLGGAMLVYDCRRDLVFDLDFEGGVERLKSGEMAPRWSSFAHFLSGFFGI